MHAALITSCHMHANAVKLAAFKLPLLLMQHRTTIYGRRHRLAVSKPTCLKTHGLQDRYC
jgi:hypothetical protein